MEIKIRNIDKSVVAAIDDLAKGQNKSRNEYLKEQLTLLARSPDIKQLEDKYNSLVTVVINALEENTELLKIIIGENDEI